MQNSICLLLLFLSILTTPLSAQKSKPQDLPFKQFTHLAKSDTLPYSLLAPADNNTGKKYPLLIFLHGKGERGNDNSKQLSHLQILLNAKNYDKYPCIVFAPQCPKKYLWFEKRPGASPGAAMQMVIDVLDKIIAEYPVDTSRIYVTGVSMGGYGTWELISRFPKRFAAAIPVCGGGDPTAAEQIKDIPIWAFHGAEDEVVAPQQSRSMIDAIRKAGGAPGYTEYPDVKHNSWTWAFRDPNLLPWLFKQHRH